MMSDLYRHTEQNRRAWNEIAAIRHASMQPAQFFANGGSTLTAEERLAAGDVTGKTLLHLQCATGEDTLSWANAGVQATGVDISDAQIALARQKALEAGLDVSFVAADVLALPADLQQATFDYVYTGGGALVWLPNLTLWAQSIMRALKQGGKFVLHEEHPVASCLWVEDSKLQISADYFGHGQALHVEPGWSHFKGGEQATEAKVEFIWGLGDVVTTLIKAGLRIESLQEFPSNAEWRFAELLSAMRKLPGRYLLAARKAVD